MLETVSNWPTAIFGVATIAGTITATWAATWSGTQSRQAKINSQPVSNGFTAHVLDDLRAIRDEMKQDRELADARHIQNVTEITAVKTQLADLRDPPAAARQRRNN
jgi:hypothetical protein